MALSAHEMILVLRARDEASRVLRSFSNNLSQIDKESAQRANRQFAIGSSLATAGVALVGISAAVAVGFGKMTTAASDYAQQVALTKTQVDDAGVGLGELHKMGIDLARDMPVQFNEVQDALYDVFSSIEVNGPQANKILRGIGKAAVGGNVDMQTAGRGILQIMNAWQMKAKDVGEVNDVMFQLVRKGVGDYDEFTSSLGRAIPSAVRAGASVEDLAGMMAYLTRNGLNTRMAATSAARAFDAMTNPKTAENMKKFGISVKDAEGNFRPMTAVVGDMREKLKGMNDVARARALKEMFQGSGGTIQAMRFFNLAVQDGSGLFDQLTKDMYNAEGAANAAYKTMSNTPQAKLQAMSNEWEVLKVNVGNVLLPIRGALAGGITKLLEFFNNLSPSVQSTVVKVIAVATAITGLIGVVAAVAGVFLMFQAAATMAGVSLATVATIGGGVVLGILAIVAAGYLIYKNWDMIKAAAISVWGSIVSYMQPTITAAKQIGQAMLEFGQLLWGRLKPGVMDFYNSLKSGAMTAWNAIKPAFTMIGDMVNFVMEKFASAGKSTTLLSTAIKVVQIIIIQAVDIIRAVLSTLGAVLGTTLAAIGAVFTNIVAIITGVVTLIFAIITGDWAAAWQAAKDIVYNLFAAIGNIIKGAVLIIWNILKGLFTIIVDLFKNLWDILVGHSIIPDTVNAIIEWFAKLPGRLVAIVTKVVTSVISWFTKMGTMAFNKVKSFVTKVVTGFISLVSKVVSKVASLYNKVVSWFAKMISKVVSKVSSFVKKLINFYIQLGVKIVATVLNFVKKVINWFQNLASQVSAKVTQLKNKVISHFNNLRSQASNAVQSMKNKVVSIFNAIRSTISSVVSNIRSRVSSGFNSVKSAMSNALNAARNVVRNAWNSIRSAFSNGISRAVGLARSLPGKIRSALGNLGGLLLGAGRSVIQGFINGVTGMIGSLRNKFSSITNMIPDWKGPLDKDKKLLSPAGNAIMGGLMKAIDGQRSNLRGTLGAVTEQVKRDGTKGLERASRAMARAADSGLGRAGADGAMELLRGMQSKESRIIRAAAAMGKNVGSAMSGEITTAMDGRTLAKNLMKQLPTGTMKRRLASTTQQPYQPVVPYPRDRVDRRSEPSQTNVQVDVHTEEINPVKHAADLGYEIAGRLGM